MNQWVTCATFLFFSMGLHAQVPDSITSIWQGEWEDPSLQKWIRASGEIRRGENEVREVAIYGGGWHEGGHDCFLYLVNDSTGLAEFCPVFGNHGSEAIRVGVRHALGTRFLVHLDVMGNWLDWVSPEPAWRMKTDWPLFEAWRTLAGSWEQEEAPLAHLLEVSGQRCEAKLSRGWGAMALVFDEFEHPVPNVIRLGNDGVFSWAMEGNMLTMTRMKSMGDPEDVEWWEETEEVVTYRRVSAVSLAPFKGLGGDYPELSLSPVNRQHLDQPWEALRFMRNEIFARHGWRFGSEDLRAHFEAQSWYSPVKDNGLVKLSAVERFNVECIREREDRLRSSQFLPIVFAAEWAEIGVGGLEAPDFGAPGADHCILLRESDGACRIVNGPLSFTIADEHMQRSTVSAVGHEGQVVATFPGMDLLSGTIWARHQALSLAVGDIVTIGSDRFTLSSPDLVPGGFWEEGGRCRFQRIDAEGNPTGGHTEFVYTSGRVNVDWAGDLNGDGRTDVIVQYHPKYSYAVFELWMSDPVTGALKFVRRSDRVFGC